MNTISFIPDRLLVVCDVLKDGRIAYCLDRIRDIGLYLVLDLSGKRNNEIRLVHPPMSGHWCSVLPPHSVNFGESDPWHRTVSFQNKRRACSCSKLLVELDNTLRSSSTRRILSTEELRCAELAKHRLIGMLNAQRAYQPGRQASRGPPCHPEVAAGSGTATARQTQVPASRSGMEFLWNPRQP
jgi:hypothetical protein